MKPIGNASDRIRHIISSEPQLAFLGALDMARPGLDDATGAEWFLVGGAVRDAVLGRAGRKDFDLLVRGASLDDISDRLSQLGDVNLVGKRFGVLKFRAHDVPGEVDIAWPRTERAGGSGGYRDFSVQADPTLPIARDLERRDFTVNAIAWDLDRAEFVDTHGGLADIERRVLRAVGAPAERFQEDYSRMLRAIRFACELGFQIEPATWQALVRLAPRISDVAADGERVVPLETVARELAKALAADPSRAVALLEESGLLYELIPELRVLSACQQSPDHHSEGDVWTHTKLALASLSGAAFAAEFAGEKADALTALAVLLHDIAKPETASPGPGGLITFYGHAERGAELAAGIAKRLHLDSAGIDTDELAWLVKMHLVPNALRVDEVRRTTLEKHFLRDPAAGMRLLQLAFVDASAAVRPDGATDLSSLRELRRALAALEAQGAGKTAVKSLLSGDEIMEILGMSAGPAIGQILEELREAQLSGKVNTPEEAREFLRPGQSRD